jgi:phosphoglycolate phosphatase
VRFRLAIFDFDGTLADSFPWFVAHFNDAAKRFGFRPVSGDEVELLRSFGPREVLRQLRIPLWKVPLIARHFRRLKAEHADEIRIFPGATATLEALKAEGVQLALVTSDSEPNVRRQLGSSHFELFSAVECNASLFGKAAKFDRTEPLPSKRNRRDR